jgi:hypothetical protein
MGVIEGSELGANEPHGGTIACPREMFGFGIVFQFVRHGNWCRRLGCIGVTNDLGALRAIEAREEASTLTSGPFKVNAYDVRRGPACDPRFVPLQQDLCVVLSDRPILGRTFTILRQNDSFLRRNGRTRDK